MINQKSFLFLFLCVFFVGVVSAEVNELNYFKKGVVDSSGNLIETSEAVSGVSVLGVVCADSECSSISSYLWGGALYASGDSITLVYPSVLVSSYGYGVYVYKDGYIPYEIEADWYGFGNVGPYNDYLSQKQYCFSEILDVDLDLDEDDLSFELEVASPVEEDYDLKFMPPSILDYHRTRVDVFVELLRDGNIVFSESDWVNPEFSQSGIVDFDFSDLGDGSYDLRVWTSLANENKCLGYGEDLYEYSFVVDTYVYDDDKDDDGYKDNVDCNDNDASVWQILYGYLDGDRDGYGAGSLRTICSGSSLPPGYVVNNNDCDDSSSSIWQILYGYVDVDNDGYGSSSSPGVCSGNSLLSGYVSIGGDCNDYNYYVNPGLNEVCGDGVDNDCNGRVDENCVVDLIPSAFASGDPVSGVAPLVVSFVCQGTGGDGSLSYSWDFGDGGSSSSGSVVHSYLSPGSYNAVCVVTDSDGDSDSDSVSVGVGSAGLDVVDVECFDEVVVGHNQSCSVFVEDSSGNEVGGASVDIYYSDGREFGSCSTNSISGSCGVKDLQGAVGDYEVYAVASKSGYSSDSSGSLRFEYEVLEEEYDIDLLRVWSDSAFSVESYDFFRGEELFVSFRVLDSFGNEVVDDLITSVSLVSSSAGGRIDLDRVSKNGAEYRYDLDEIPLSHDFIGDSNVFAFVFDLVDSAGGQEEVSLIIRNNLPSISVISDREVEEGDSFSLGLGSYGNDLEDSGDDLRWELVSFGSRVNVSLVGKNLIVEGLSLGNSDVVLRLYDLDDDYDEFNFSVKVVEEEDDDDDDDDYVRESFWSCAPWSSCSDGVMSRMCVDDSSGEREIETQSCGSGLFDLSEGVIDLGGFVAGEADSTGYVWFWILLLLILLMVVLVLGFWVWGRG